MRSNFPKDVLGFGFPSLKVKARDLFFKYHPCDNSMIGRIFQKIKIVMIFLDIKTHSSNYGVKLFSQGLRPLSHFYREIFRN